MDVPDEMNTAAAQFPIPWATEGWQHFATRYGYPTFAIAALIAIERLSPVGIDLWVISGVPAAIIAWSYCALLVATYFSDAMPRLHHVGAVLGTACFVGRAGGFIELVLGGNWGLTGAVIERGLIIWAAFTWHSWMSWHTAANEAHREATADL